MLYWFGLHAIFLLGRDRDRERERKKERKRERERERKKRERERNKEINKYESLKVSFVIVFP